MATIVISKRPSFLYTNNIFNKNSIKKEYEFRIKNGFKAQYFTKKNNPFAFDFQAGLYCEDGGAEFNPYLFTKQLIENSKNQNSIYENTEINSITQNENGFIANTNFNEKIFCKKIIFATGYNFELFKSPSQCIKKISYSIVTKPIPEIKIWNHSLLQDDKTPYHYLRELPEKRVIFGGEDTSYKGFISNKISQKKYKKLKKDLIKLFPKLKNKIEIEYQFCGAFGETKNNLGIIG